MASMIDIHSEQECAGGWTFVVEITSSAGAIQPCQIKLAFADYNLWCASGSCAPVDVARAVVKFMLQEGGTLPDAFDASLARRKFRDADAMIPQLIRE